MSFDVSFSFPKDLKIRKTSEYDRIFGKSKRLTSEHFIILYAPNSLGYPRAGFVVAKKNVSGAVGRNRVKRILRDIFRRNKSLFDSMDFVFVAKSGSDSLDYARAKEEIEETIRSKLL